MSVPLGDVVLEATDIETIGASAVGDFTWKQLFDTDACTMCGRCTSVCPAHATGKPLGTETFKAHLDGYDQTDLLSGKGPGKRREIFYFDAGVFRSLYAIKSGDQKEDHAAVPALVKALESEHDVREFIVKELGRMGPRASAAVPALAGLVGQAIGDRL